MFRSFRHLLSHLTVLALVTLGVVTVSASPAAAITGGQPDGNKHPNVGMILYYAPERYSCTATLVSPTVLVTAAHCTYGTVGKTIVTFDSVIAEQPPAPVPAAADPSLGYTPADVAGTSFLTGTAYAHPDFDWGVDKKSWNDVGVIVLDAPVTGITTAPLAPLNYLEQFRPPLLSKTIFTTVGYGTNAVKPPSGPQKPTPQSYPLLRRYAQQPGQKLTKELLALNGNPKDPRGTGGTCFGDSGGPTFHNGYLVAVTSYGHNDVCRWLAYMERTDIAKVQNWLATFGIYPAQ